ncbi:MAG: dihydrofolate reductase family protein [Planctomycetaceae bacterium]|nr:dihydrofolate reductase family protein [Planctomycetaceae bacterium]
MTCQCSVFIAQSLDGFIAKPDDSIEWLDAVPELEGDFDYGYRELFDSVDALVFGRRTYNKVDSFADWPYGEKPIVVMSRTASAPSVPSDRCVTFTHETPQELVHRLTAEGATRLYIDGGQLIQAFLRADLIDDLNVSTIPVLLGDGIPLFGELPVEVWLDLQQSASFANGIVQTQYHVRRDRTRPDQT